MSCDAPAQDQQITKYLSGCLLLYSPGGLKEKALKKERNMFKVLI